MFTDTLRPVLLCHPSVDGFSSSFSADIYPPGASTGTSTDDTSTLGPPSPSLSTSDIRREHTAVTERNDDGRKSIESKDKDEYYKKGEAWDKDEDRDGRGDRDMDCERNSDKVNLVGINNEKAASRLCCPDNGMNVRNSPRMKSQSVDTYQVSTVQTDRFLKISSSSDDYTDMTHISLDNNDSSESVSVSLRMEQLIQEAELSQNDDVETAQERRKRIIALVTRPKASRLPEMEGKYGTPTEPARDPEPLYSTTLASSKPSNVLSSLHGAKRRVSFGTAVAECKDVTRPRYQDGTEARAQDRMLAKLLQNKEVEIGSIKQLMGLENFQAQLMRSTGGVRSMRKRLEEEIVQQRAVYEVGIISQNSRSRRAMSALTYLHIPAPKPYLSPRRHSANSGLLTLDQRMQLDDMTMHAAETAAPTVPVCNPIFDPNRYAAAAIASYAACKMEARVGEMGESIVGVKDSPDPTASLLPAGDTNSIRDNAVSRSLPRKKASNGNGRNSSPSGPTSKSKASTRPVSRKFKLIRELADLARKHSEESITANREDPDHSVASSDSHYTFSVPSGTRTSSLERHSSSASAASFLSSMGSPSSGSTPKIPSPKEARYKTLDCIERVATGGGNEEVEGEDDDDIDGQRHRDAETLRLQENRKKYQFWFKVVQILSIKNLMSARVADQIEEARVSAQKGHVRAANRIGVCYLRYFKRRMNRLMAVYRRDHKAARRPIRLMVGNLLS